MAMIRSDHRQVVSVFLASPGDLDGERRVSRTIVNELNNALCRHVGLHIELLGWEDTLPGTGRPQEIINQDVDSCDLFIGVIWKRWGSSTSKTGKYTSGFQEEFERAVERNKADGVPQIWLSFKQIDSDQLEDPGAQLRQVIAFKERITSSKELLFKEFRSQEDWERLLRGWLTEHISRNLIPPLMEQRSDSAQRNVEASSTTQSVPDESAESQVINEPSYLQLKEVLDLVHKSVAEQNSKILPSDDPQITELEVNRLFLLAASGVSDLYPSEFLRSHVVNTLYRYRGRLQATGQEKHLIMRSMLTDRDAVLPGWYWFGKESHEHENWWSPYALIDRSEFVRKATIDLLNSSNIVISGDSHALDDFIRRFLADDSVIVRTATLNYLESKGEIQHIALIDGSVKPEDSLKTNASRAKNSVMARLGDPNMMFSSILDGSVVPNGILNPHLDTRSSEITSENLRKGLEHNDVGVKQFSVKHLMNRGELEQADAHKLIEEETDRYLKMISYTYLADIGVSLDPETVGKSIRESSLNTTFSSYSKSDMDQVEDLLVRLYRKFSIAQLRQKESEVLWFDVNLPILMKAFGLEYFDQVRDEIRDALNDDYESYIQLSEFKLREKFSLGSEDTFSGIFTPELREIARANLITAALWVLTQKGNQQDIDVARHYLVAHPSDGKYVNAKMNSVRIIVAFGVDADVPTLLQIAEIQSGDLKEESAKAVLTLSPGSGGSAKQLLGFNDPLFTKLSINSLLEEDPASVDILIEPLLLSDNEQVRLEALAYFIRHHGVDELENLLSRYLLKPSYYYNVVCWLDRVLYAPIALRQSYSDELARYLA